MNRNEPTVQQVSHVRAKVAVSEDETVLAPTLAVGEPWVRTLTQAAPAGTTLLEILTAFHHAPLPSEYYELVGLNLDEVA